MSHRNIIRAWKDEEYRLSLRRDGARFLPDHPAGLVELPDEQLNVVAGGVTVWISSACCSVGCRTIACGPKPQ
jgi:mersacidin/lichenicidin family type 2 lantibiotic